MWALDLSNLNRPNREPLKQWVKDQRKPITEKELVTLLRKSAEFRPGANAEQRQLMVCIMQMIKRTKMDELFPSTVQKCKTLWIATMICVRSSN